MQMVQVILASSGECGHGRRLRKGKYKVWTSTTLDRSTTFSTSLLKMALTLLHSSHQAACYSSEKGKEMCVNYSGQS